MAECGSTRGSGLRRARRGPSGLSGAAGALAAGLVMAACSGNGGGDAWAEHCVAVLRYRMPDLTSISVETVTHGPRVCSVAFEASAEAGRTAPRLRDRITCRFSPDDPWSLASAAIGERELSPEEIALVNAELLLTDLSRHPERLGRDASQADASPPDARSPAGA